MKRYAPVLVTLMIAMLKAQAQQGVQTITLNGAIATNSPVITVPTNSYAILKSFSYGAPPFTSSSGGAMYIQANIQGINMLFPPSSAPVEFAGPATIQLVYAPNGPGGNFVGYATFDIEPGPYPPGKAVTIGAYSGNVQVTMETSTDLVNWTAAVNGAVYTNSPTAQFFRITLVKNATP